MSGDEPVALCEHATPLSTTDSEADEDVPANLADEDVPANLADEDVPANLADDLAAADVVGLGEVTHGTRECADLKGRVVRHLVAERGFRTVAFEADVARTMAVDAAVRGDEDPREALRGASKWFLPTESVADLLSWLRAFNADRPADDRVRVRGVDLSDPSVPARPLRELLAAADVVPVPNDLETLAAADGPPDEEAARERYLTRSETVAATVRKRLDDARADFEDATAPETWALTRHLADAVAANCEWHRVRHEQPGPHEAGMTERDRAMADNVEWCLEHNPGEGVAVWAHNTHVQRGSFDDGTAWTDGTPMGEHLDDALGDGYRVLGFDVARGSFRAHDGGDPEATDPRTFTFDEPLDGTLTARLDDLADGDGPDAPFAVDLGAAARDEEALADGRIRWVGSVYDPDADEGLHYQATDLPASYDWLCFLGESTPTRRLAE